MPVTQQRVNRLKEYREALVRPKISQEDIARKVCISTKTYRNAEADISIRYDTALLILKAINALRKERGMVEVDIETLGLNYQ